jgi:ABC-type glycerol-3-phosphate transport system substrate-binding protein
MKFTRSLALVLVMILCVGLLAACGNKGTDATTPSTKPAVTTTAEKEIVGIVTQVSSSFVKLELYTVEEGFDYLTLDVNTLTASGETDFVYINSTAVYDYVKDGALVGLKAGCMEVGHIVAVVKNVKGIQQFVLLNYSTETATTPTNAG